MLNVIQTYVMGSTLLAPVAWQPSCLQMTWASLLPASRSQACPNALEVEGMISSRP